MKNLKVSVMRDDSFVHLSYFCVMWSVELFFINSILEHEAPVVRLVGCMLS